MDPVILAFITAWLLMRGYEALKAEWRHTRDGYARTLGKDHPDWSPARVRRNARHAARSWWWTELGDGLPTFRASWEKDKLLARTQREEMLAAGEKGLRALRDRLETAIKARQDAAAERKAAGAPEPPPDGAPGKPVLTGIPGGKAPRRGTPPPGTPVPATPEPPSPEPAGTGGPPEPPDGAPQPEPSGNGTGRKAAPLLDAIPPPSSEEQGDTPMPGDDALAIASTAAAQAGQVANGGQVTTAPSPADVESGDSPYDGMLTAISNISGSARRSASTAGDDLRAAASVHGFSRDTATMAGIAEVEDALAAAAAAAERLRAGMVARHADGDEYHSGHDAHASAFRAT